MTADMTEAKRIEHLREEESRRDENALRYLLEDERGRWFIQRMMERCHVFASTIPADGNASRMFVAEGERRVGVELYENLKRLSVIDKSGTCEMQRRMAEMEYGRFMALYEKGEATK